VSRSSVFAFNYKFFAIISRHRRRSVLLRCGGYKGEMNHSNSIKTNIAFETEISFHYVR
jgi:hypothetical protein